MRDFSGHRKTSSSLLDFDFVRGLSNATVQYSSFCGDSVPASSEHMGDDDQDRGDEENGLKVETLDNVEEINGKRQRTVRHMMICG